MRKIGYAAYYLLTAGAVFVALRRDCSGYNLLLCLAALLLPLVPWVLYRLLHWTPMPRFEVLFCGFVFLAVPFASLYGAYEMIPYWDKILHFLSGFVLAMVGMGIYFVRKPGHRVETSDRGLCPLFCFLFAVFSAVAWEIWEFFVSFFGADPQQVATTGVTDTMTDMIVCLIGGLLTAIACARYLRQGDATRSGLMMRVFDEFRRKNLVK